MYQGQNFEAFVLLKDSMGVPVSTLAYTDLTVRTWNTKQTVMQPLTLALADLVNLGSGMYVIKIDKSLYPNVGEFALEVKGSLIADTLQVYPVDPTPLSFLQSPSVCVVSGNIMEITGQASSNREEVSFRISKLPSSVSGSLVTSERMIVYPDAYGNFSVQLLRFSEIIVEIKRAGINYKFTVPNQATAPLLGLIPPI